MAWDRILTGARKWPFCWRLYFYFESQQYQLSQHQLLRLPFPWSAELFQTTFSCVSKRFSSVSKYIKWKVTIVKHLKIVYQSKNVRYIYDIICDVRFRSTYSYVSIKNSYQIIVLLKGFSKINKNSVLNKSSESENELLI